MTSAGARNQDEQGSQEIAEVPQRRLNGKLPRLRLKLKSRRFSRHFFASCHARLIRNVRHSTSVQSFYLRCHSSWADVPDGGWNRQLAVGDNGPIPCSLAIIVGHLLDNDVAGRCAGGPLNSICFF